MKKPFSSKTVTAFLLGAFLLGSAFQGLACPRQAARAGKAVVQGGGISRPQIGAVTAAAPATEGQSVPSCRKLPARPASASVAAPGGHDRLHPFPPAPAPPSFSSALFFLARIRPGRITPPHPHLAHIRTVVLLN